MWLNYKNINNIKIEKIMIKLKEGIEQLKVKHNDYLISTSYIDIIINYNNKYYLQKIYMNLLFYKQY